MRSIAVLDALPPKDLDNFEWDNIHLYPLIHTIVLRCLLNTPLKPNTMLNAILLKISPISNTIIRSDTFMLALDRGNYVLDSLQ